MLTRIDLRGAADVSALLDEPSNDDANVVAAVREIIADVRARGDDALRELTLRFDGFAIDDLRVGKEMLDAAWARAEPEFRSALAYAHGEIRAYHEAQLQPAPRLAHDGIELEEMVQPVDRAGLYVPGGRASYPSTVLMTAVPAEVAGVPELALCVPPRADGTVGDATLAAAAFAGIGEVYRVGGAQAVAALAFGTDTIRPVDVVVGPGNAYVAAAKREVAGVVGIDAFAGPSEVVVVADATTPTEFAAADLLAQVEHGPGGCAVLVTWEPAVADAVDGAIESDAGGALPSALSIVLVDDAEHAMSAVNAIAPEHLELMTADAEALVPHVRNAGAVFVGPWAPAALGDYVAGVNHVLPTARTARFASALRVDTFRKHIHVVRATAAGFDAVSGHVEVFAAAEGLPAHARSVSVRRAAALARDTR